MTKHEYLTGEHPGDHESGDVSAAAAVMGRKGGSSKTKAKQTASRTNGKKGGRPRKIHSAKCALIMAEVIGGDWAGFDAALGAIITKANGKPR